MASLTLRNIHKSFGKTAVLSAIDLDVADGEFAVIVGPSGCGKSTLLRTIAGLEEIDKGTITIGETDVSRLSPSERGIAMVFQSYALYPHMTVYDNMSFGMKIAGASAAEIEQAVRVAADTLGLTALLDRKPKELSGGQRQRTAIGRAIVRRPRIFLFDEPLSNLDASLRVKMRHEIARLHETLGTTMIYVTHDQVEAMTLADRIVVLRDGCIEQTGSPHELYKYPDNRFVAGFIGSPAMNFLAGFVVDSRQDATTVRLNSGTTIQVNAVAGELSRDTPVTLGIRPEHLATGGDHNLVEAEIKLVEPLGSHSYVYLDTTDAEDLLIFRASGDFGFAKGDKLTMCLAADSCYLFGKDGRELRRKPPGNC
ncbi:MAG: sn-glycerol-3-phosphate ABC transporter ATP-binding protein UgpC [Nitrospirales bacterium]|nr:sn-glycerol-3-phosphate ABC transporter ATP-binding protein UgpC [Nitrospira sp.]MDR4460567.1 sn-glycerol-3-phosphate ABC transporter ATP-binding protein UgpC [Nitrospirales bacterium]MDR4484977.1 sn-glycerol-3-phosphate ABC transporter ATP-binding protein UgpC [Nitrospirales bacterium]